MKNPWLLFLAPLLLAVPSSLPRTAAVPLRFRAAGRSPVQCIGDGVYAANSTYQANLRRVAALLLAEVSASPGQFYYTTRAVGYWPNRLLASSLCRRRDVNGTHVGYPCADCIAGAFLQMERACPYRREAFYIDRNCSVELAEIRIFGTGGIFQRNILIQAMASGLVLQAIGFAWLFFLLFQEWRSRKRGNLMHSTPLLSGDENVGSMSTKA